MATENRLLEPRERAIDRCRARARMQHGLISRVQALGDGLSSSGINRLLENGQWIRRRPGVYDLYGGEATWIRQLMAAVLASPGSMASIAPRVAFGAWTDASTRFLR